MDIGVGASQPTASLPVAADLIRISSERAIGHLHVSTLDMIDSIRGRTRIVPVPERANAEREVRIPQLSPAPASHPIFNLPTSQFINQS